jgi:hypothetical protein
MFDKKFNYSDLTSKQQEAYNYQKVAWVFADYGYTTIKLDDDRNWADFIGISTVDWVNDIKVQLKSRLTFWKKYQNKWLFICFIDRWSWCVYCYDHDKLLEVFTSKWNIKHTDSRKSKWVYFFPTISEKHKEYLKFSIIWNLKISQI